MIKTKLALYYITLNKHKYANKRTPNNAIRLHQNIN